MMGLFANNNCTFPFINIIFFKFLLINLIIPILMKLIYLPNEINIVILFSTNTRYREEQLYCLFFFAQYFPKTGENAEDFPFYKQEILIFSSLERDKITLQLHRPTY